VTDILAIIDAAIDEMATPIAAKTPRSNHVRRGEEARKPAETLDSVRNVRDNTSSDMVTDTVNLLINNRLSVVSVVSVKNGYTHGDSQLHNKSESSCEPFAMRVVGAPKVYIKSTDTTDITDIPEDSCGFPSVRDHVCEARVTDITDIPEDSYGFSAETTLRDGLNQAFEADSDDLDERAALIEFGAEVPREWAEGFAALCAMPPPTGFRPDRWQRIIEVTGVFLDRWAGEAIRCGWSDLDVFGCDPTAPTARFDCMGLVLLLDRCEIVVIDRDGAELITVTGARQRFYRRPMPPGTVSLWELVPR
jgi:hypothetical protein